MSDQPWTEKRKERLKAVQDFFNPEGKSRGGINLTPKPKDDGVTQMLGGTIWAKEGDEYVYTDPVTNNTQRYSKEDFNDQDWTNRKYIEELVGQGMARNLLKDGADPVDVLISLIESGTVTPYNMFERSY